MQQYTVSSDATSSWSDRYQRSPLYTKARTWEKKDAYTRGRRKRFHVNLRKKKKALDFPVVIPYNSFTRYSCCTESSTRVFYGPITYQTDLRCISDITTNKLNISVMGRSEPADSYVSVQGYLKNNNKKINSAQQPLCHTRSFERWSRGQSRRLHKDTAVLLPPDKKETSPESSL